MSLTVPFLVSCTGHRDPTDRAGLQRAASGILQDMLDRMLHTPLRVMTGLAEGSDQLCADAALALTQTDRVRVTAILAFPPDVFRDTIQDPEAKAHFDALLKNPRVDWFLAPALDERDLPSPNDIEGWQAELAVPANRRRRYQEVGTCLVLYGQAMIALWDGQPKQKSGGTGEVVDAWFEGVSYDIYPRALLNLEPFERRPLYHVWTKRACSSNLPQGGEAATVREFFLRPGTLPMSWTQSALRDLREAWRLWRKKRNPTHVLVGVTETIVASVNAICDGVNYLFGGTPIGERQVRAVFAKNQANLDHLNGSLARKSRAATLEPAARDVEGLDASALPDRVQKMLSVRRVLADAANTNNSTLKWVIVAVFGLIGVGAFLLHLYTHHIHLENGTFVWSPVLLLSGSVGIAAAWGIGFWIHRTHREAHYLDRRSLSEALRVQTYWSIAGLPDSVPASYLQRQRSELAWIRAAVRALAVPYHTSADDFLALTLPQQVERLHVVLTKWVQGQMTFFNDELSRHRVRLLCCEKLGLFSALLGWLFGLALFMDLPWLGDASHPAGTALWVLALLLLLGGLFIAYAENRHFREWAFNYEHMYHVFRNGHERLNAHLALLGNGSTPLPANVLERVHKLLRELGHEALEENADWITLHRARPFEPPVH